MFSKGVTDVFFDVDHTLWDFEKNSALTFKKILKYCDVEVSLNDFLKVYKPINFECWKRYREEKITQKELRYQRFSRTFKGLNIQVSDQLIDQLSKAYIEHLSSNTHVFKHTFEILDYLKPKYKLHIITKGPQAVQDKKLKKSKLYSYFDQVINSEMAGVKKPNRHIFNLALKLANTQAKYSVMVGDNTEADILGAKAVGFKTIHFNSNEEPKHDVCPIINELIEIKNFL